MVPLIDDEEFPDGHGSRAFLLRLGEQVFQPIQADGLLPDLRHQPKATPADNPATGNSGSAMSRWNRREIRGQGNMLHAAM